MALNREDILLQSKHRFPPLRQDAVPRQRLVSYLQRSHAHRISLITAPAGFGKTTLLREWAEQCESPVAWLALDERDNSLQRFLLYLNQAFLTLDPQLGGIGSDLLQAGRLPDSPLVLTPLLNELSASPQPLFLVLDDYHSVSDPAVHEAMEFLIAHAPPVLHILIASRSQPPFNLARLRGQAELLELSSADLRFTASEVESFFRLSMRLDLPADERLALEMRTEGWVAGLQMAGLSLQGQDDSASFIASFSGANRHIGDYLFEEALQRQPAAVREFLLQSAVAPSLCGALCDAILDAEAGSGQRMLEQLDRLGLFLVPLDSRRQWYRYHHLFGEMLWQHLRRMSPAVVPTLHRRAGRWYEEQGLLDEAIAQGLHAGDFEWAAGLIERAFEDRDWLHHDMHRLLENYEKLPQTMSDERPKLVLGAAWLMMELYADRWEEIGRLLLRVETMLSATKAGAGYSQEDVRCMLAEVDLLRANRARHAADTTLAIKHCHAALDRLPDDEGYRRSGALAHLASAYESRGQMNRAAELYEQSILLCRDAGNTDGLLFASARLIEVHIARADLRQAELAYRRALDHCPDRTGPDVGLLHIAMAEVQRERNQLEAARENLLRGIALCRPFDAWRMASLSGFLRLARVCAALGRPEESRQALREADEYAARATPAERAYLERGRIVLLLSQDDYSAAAAWAMNSGIDLSDGLPFAREPDCLTYVRVLLAQAALEARALRPKPVSAQALDEAAALLQAMAPPAQKEGREACMAEIQLLQALLHYLRRQTQRAQDCLAEALAITVAAGHIRLFADEGPPIRQLLQFMAAGKTAGIPLSYLQTILAAFPAESPAVAKSGAIALGSDLSKRELTALGMLASDRTIEEIAALMFVSVSTVRTYAKRIYAKLDVHSRAEAVFRARELNILT